MTDSAKISSSINAVGKQVKTVIADIQARPDYSGSSQLKAMASNLRTFSQHVLNNETNGTARSYQELRAEASTRIVQEVHKLIDANIEMAGLGQLNTKRKVQPSVLQSQNKTLEGFLASLENMIAQIGQPAVGKAEAKPSATSSSAAVPGNSGSASSPAHSTSSEKASPMTNVMAPPLKDQVFKGVPNFKDVPTYEQLMNVPASSLSDDL